MRILVVDDEFVALTKMITILSEYGECDGATNGKQAYEMYSEAMMQEAPYGLVTIDINMPEWDGLSLLERIRKNEESVGCAPMRKIVMTAEGQAQTVIAAGNLNCDAYLIKPVQRAVLCKKVEELGIRIK